MRLVVSCGISLALAGAAFAAGGYADVSTVYAVGPDGVPIIEERLPLSDAKLPAGECREHWMYVGSISAVIYWQCENRATSFVEYGHTVTYNDDAVEFPDEKWTSRLEGSKAVFGLKISARKAVKFLNGAIRQGKGRSMGTAVGYGCNPLHTAGPPNGTEIGAVEFVWTGMDISGLVFGWGQEAVVHHCVMEDRGTQITNRHQGCGGPSTGRGRGNPDRQGRQRGV